MAGSAADNKAASEYAHWVAAKLDDFFVEVPHSANDHHNDAIKKAFEKGCKFVLCVGPAEVSSHRVSVEGRQPAGSKEKGPIHYGTCTVEEAAAWFKQMRDSHVLDENLASIPSPAFVKADYKDRKKDSTSSDKSNKTASAASVGGTKRDQQEAGLASPVKADKPSGDVSAYQVAGASFPTNVKTLSGKSFASVEEFVAFLQQQ